MSSAIGLDLGSRRTKCVLLGDGKILAREIFESWALDRKRITQWLEQISGKHANTSVIIGTTGYSRRMAAEQFSGAALTEIKAIALGASLLFPHAGTLVDIGGQDAKAIHLDDLGRVEDFDMNDRCAAGTGKFFELLAQTLGCDLTGLSNLADAADHTEVISNTCAVFAESEIISKLADGVAPAAIAKGVFRSVAERLCGMLQRVGCREPALLLGGGAGRFLAAEISMMTKVEFKLHSDGLFFGAVGAAIFADTQSNERNSK